MAATRATSLDILCPASHSRDYHALQPIIRGRTCRAPAHLRSNFAQSTGVENADQTVPVFDLNTAHSYFIRLSTPIALSVQLCGTNPVPGKFAGGGGTVVSYKFIYARGLNWLQQCSKVPFSNLPLNLMSGELVMCTTHFAGKAVYVFRAACPQPYTCFDQSPGFAKHRQVQFTSATGSV